MSRFLRKLLLYTGGGTEAENRTIRIREDVVSPPSTGSNVDVTLTASAGGTEYWLSGDDVTGDFFEELEDALTAALVQGTSVSVDVNGVGVTDTTKAQGRIKVDYQSSGGSNHILVLDLDATQTTLPAGSIGRVHTSDWSITGGTPQWSPSIHRFGWYPQIAANFMRPTRHTRGEFIGMRGSTTLDGLTWGDFERLLVQYDRGILSPFVYPKSLDVNSAWATVVGLASTSSTDYGSWEQFCSDVAAALAAGNGEEAWRFYPDLSAVHLSGNYVWPDDAPGWTDPTGHGEIVSLPNEEWGAWFVEGRRDL